MYSPRVLAFADNLLNKRGNQSFCLDISMPAFNPLVAKLSPPPVPSVAAWGRAYDGSQGPLIDLSQAVPGYPAHPDMLKLLGETGSSTAFTGYGPIEGEAELRRVYAEHVSEVYGASLG